MADRDICECQTQQQSITRSISIPYTTNRLHNIDYVIDVNMSTEEKKEETPKPTVVMVTGGSGLVGQGIKEFVTEDNNKNRKVKEKAKEKEKENLSTKTESTQE